MNPLHAPSATTQHEVLDHLDQHDEELVADQAANFLRTLNATLPTIQHGSNAARSASAQRLAASAEAIGAHELGRCCRALMAQSDPESALAFRTATEAGHVAASLQAHLAAA